jgi:hypothetical protein
MGLELNHKKISALRTTLAKADSIMDTHAPRLQSKPLYFDVFCCNQFIIGTSLRDFSLWVAHLRNY